jgi:hypothetical protein
MFLDKIKVREENKEIIMVEKKIIKVIKNLMIKNINFDV